MGANDVQWVDGDYCVGGGKRGGSLLYWMESGKMCRSMWSLMKVKADVHIRLMMTAANHCTIGKSYMLLQFALFIFSPLFHKCWRDRIHMKRRQTQRKLRMQQFEEAGYILAWKKKSSDLVSTFSTFLNWVQLYKIELNANVKRFNSVAPPTQTLYISAPAWNWVPPDKCPTFSFRRPRRVFG